MAFVRTIINSDKLDNIITIPDDLKHQEVEVLVLPITESIEVNKTDFDPDAYSGTLQLSSEEIENELKALRDEWERS